MNIVDRRRFLITSALGLGSLPLRSIVTGLPIPLLMGMSGEAIAAATSAQYLIMSHMNGGDPLNTNVPGSYPNDPSDSSDPLRFIQHATVAELGAAAAEFEVPRSYNLGNTAVKAAGPWADLPADLRQQMAFWHHGTYVNAHSEQPSVMRLGGALKDINGTGSAQLGSLVAEELNSALATSSKEIVMVGGAQIQAQGRNLQPLSPTSLKGIFISSEANLDKMIALRNRYLDQTYKTLKTQGTPAQRRFLDQYAISQQEATTMGSGLGDLLSGVTSNNADGQIKAAVALLKLNIAPAVTLGFGFGGDNHFDSDLEDEVTATTSGVAAIGKLWAELKTQGLQDKTTFATLNVFGRSLRRASSGGRNHNGNHHCMVVFGPNIKAGVVGGFKAINAASSTTDMKAAPINSVTGGTGGITDIPFEHTLASVGKTLIKAVGISDTRLNLRVDGKVGKVISGALI
jgi:hypothetical protein